jgi:uncharacterized protein
MIKFNKYKGVQVKVSKLKDLKFENNHPKEINEGYVFTGVVNVDESNSIQSLFVIDDDKFFHTSHVQEMEEHEGYDLLRTLNSVYKVEPIIISLPGMMEKYNLKLT